METVAEIKMVVEGEITREQASIVHAVSEGHSGYAIANVRVSPNGDGAWLEATNGHVLAVTHADKLQCNSPVNMPPSMLAKPNKGWKHHAISFDGRAWTDRATGRMAESVEGNYPRTDDILRLTQTLEPAFSVFIDARLLLQLQKAMGCDSVRLDVAGNMKPIRVTANSGVVADDGQFGLIMPMEANRQNSTWNQRVEQFLASYCVSQ